jgi:hypothetical protein
VSIAGNPTNLGSGEEQKLEQHLGHSAGMGGITQGSNGPSAGRVGDIGQIGMSTHNRQPYPSPDDVEHSNFKPAKEPTLGPIEDAATIVPRLPQVVSNLDDDSQPSAVSLPPRRPPAPPIGPTPLPEPFSRPESEPEEGISFPPNKKSVRIIRGKKRPPTYRCNLCPKVTGSHILHTLLTDSHRSSLEPRVLGMLHHLIKYHFICLT